MQMPNDVHDEKYDSKHTLKNQKRDSEQLQ